MALCETINFSQVPLISLRSKTRHSISQMLNGFKVIPSPSGLPRDWRGLGHIAAITLPPLNSCDPTNSVLEKWGELQATFKDLIEAFKELDRWDVLYDTFSSINDDAACYFNSKNCDNNMISTNEDENKLILTVDDVPLAQNGMNLQIYDAFLLFSDEDTEFTLEVVNKLENEYGLKLCLKDRDLVAGITFEHEAIMRLISERCNRLIIIVSPSFLNSPANKFFVTYAQALGIEKGQRKIIPLIYKRFPLPRQLRYYYVLDYTRKSQLWDFWKILSNSIISYSKDAIERNNIEPVVIREIKEKEEEIEDRKLVLVNKKPEHWDCPVKSDNQIEINEQNTSKSSSNQADLNETNEQSLEKRCIKKNQKVSLFKKILPKSLKSKSRSKSVGKKSNKECRPCAV